MAGHGGLLLALPRTPVFTPTGVIISKTNDIKLAHIQQTEEKATLMILSNLAALQAQAVVIITSFHAAIFCTGFPEISNSGDTNNWQPSRKAWLPNHLRIYSTEESLSDLVNIVCLRNLCSFLQLVRPPTQLRGMLFKAKWLQVFPPTLMCWIWTPM